MNRKAYQQIKDKVHIALKAGRLIKKPCSVCGVTEKVEAHHPDYDYPLEVVWLCRQHHYEKHGKGRSKVIQTWNYETKRWDVEFAKG